MNDNTIIRIKVPARLYESVKAKLMIKENYEAPVKEEAEELKESPIVDVIAALSGVLGLGLTGVAISKAQDLLKKKNPELFDKLQSAGAAMKNQGVGLNEDKKAAPADLERSKKITASLEKREKAEREKEDRMIAAAMAKKKKEAEAKKVADKKAADKKKADEKKK
jgi:colicin import membrane protein